MVKSVGAAGVVVLSACLVLAPMVSAHIGMWHESMFCRNGPQTIVNWNTNTVVNPLYQLKFEDYWFGNGVYNGVSARCYNYPPPAGKFLELPAGGSFDVQFANNRAFSSLGLNGGQVSTFPDGQPHPELDAPGYYNDKCVPNPNLHTKNKADVAGSAFAISYHSEYSQVKPENMAVFSVAYGTPWHTKASFQVPANMPACPSGGCLCGWGWVPNNCGTPNIYLQLFRCKVTGAKANAPAIAPPKPPVWCENNPSKCVKGSKQMVIWHQAERNNVDTNTGTGVAGEQADHDQKSPGYNLKLGFKNGAQNDIFVSTPTTTKKTTTTRPTSTKKTTSTRKPTSTKKATSTRKTSSTKRPTSTKKVTSTTRKTSSVRRPTSTRPPQPTNTAWPPRWSLLAGCVKDMAAPNRLMSFKVNQVNMTPTTCVSYCDKNGYKFAGVEYGTECHCSNASNTSGGAGVAAKGCNVKCPGDKTKNCGGNWRMEVFMKK